MDQKGGIWVGGEGSFSIQTIILQIFGVLNELFSHNIFEKLQKRFVAFFGVFVIFFEDFDKLKKKHTHTDILVKGGRRGLPCDDNDAMFVSLI